MGAADRSASVGEWARHTARPAGTLGPRGGAGLSLAITVVGDGEGGARGGGDERLREEPAAQARGRVRLRLPADPRPSPTRPPHPPGGYPNAPVRYGNAPHRGALDRNRTASFGGSLTLPPANSRRAGPALSMCNSAHGEGTTSPGQRG